MTKNFNAISADLKKIPVIIYITQSELYSGYYNVSIQFQEILEYSTFPSENNFGNFYLQSELKPTEFEAQVWAIDKLKIRLNESVKLVEIFD